MNNLHRKQFIISENYIYKRNIKNECINNSMYLSYHKDLNIKIAYSSDNEKSYILGHAFQIDPERESPELEVYKYDSIEECIRTWAGRYILIYKNKLYLDTCGTLGCFYSKDDNGRVLISSSISLLNELKNQGKMSCDPIKHAQGMDWYPGPMTNSNGISRLLPGQVIVFDKNDIQIDSINYVNFNYNKMSTEEKIKTFCFYFVNLIKNIDKFYEGSIIIPLTAGYDSRTILSICIKSGVEFSTYTQEHDKISNADIQIPKTLSEKFKFKHVFIPRDNKLSMEKINEFDMHTSKNCVDADRLFYGYNQFEVLEKEKNIVLRGGIWEVARGFYSKILIKDGDKIEKIKSLTNTFTNINKSELHYQSLNLWLDKLIDRNDMDWRDRFYLEQRVGSWLSSIEQALDLTSLDRIHPLNNIELISILMSIPPDERYNGKHQCMIIKECCPELIKYPFNKKTFKEEVLRYYKAIIRILNKHL